MGDFRGKRSKFEARCGDVLEPQGFVYERHAVQYTVAHNYTPDFVYTIDGGYQILVEVKGWFRPGDRQKYKAIRDALDDSQELVFLLQNPRKIIQKGGRLTMSGWCDKEGLKWFSTPEEVVQYVIDNE